MFNNVLTPTPYYPFDCSAPVADIPVGTLLKDSTGQNLIGGIPAPFLSPQQAFELRYNVKTMLINVPVYEIGDSISAGGNLMITRYTIPSSNQNNIKFVCAGTLLGDTQVGLLLNFYIDFSLGVTWFPDIDYAPWNQNAWFTPVTYFNGYGNTSSNTQYYLLGDPAGTSISFQYWGDNDTTNTGGFYSPFMDQAFIGVGLTNFIGSGLALDLNPPEQTDNGGIVCTERYDEVSFTPASIDPTVQNIITISSPATLFAQIAGFDDNRYRNGLGYATFVSLEGIGDIPLATSSTPASQASFTILSSQTGLFTVKDIIKINLPANSGIQTGRIGISSVYPPNGTEDTFDYFETLELLSVT